MKADGIGLISMATSKGVRPPQSFLQAWATQACKSRFGDQGSQASKILIEGVNTKVCTFAMTNGISKKQAVLDFASDKYASRDLKKLCSQVFNAGNFIV